MNMCSEIYGTQKISLKCSFQPWAALKTLYFAREGLGCSHGSYADGYLNGVVFRL